MTLGRHKFTSVDEYIASLPSETGTILSKIRTMIKKIIPNVTERISYNVPGFFANGKYVIYFAGYKNHIGLYPIPKGNNRFLSLIKPYIKGKGTLQFPLNSPIPFNLVEDIIKTATKH